MLEGQGQPEREWEEPTGGALGWEADRADRMSMAVPVLQLSDRTLREAESIAHSHGSVTWVLHVAMLQTPSCAAPRVCCHRVIMCCQEGAAASTPCDKGYPPLVYTAWHGLYSEF